MVSYQGKQLVTRTSRKVVLVYGQKPNAILVHLCSTQQTERCDSLKLITDGLRTSLSWLGESMILDATRSQNKSARRKNCEYALSIHVTKFIS